MIRTWLFLLGSLACLHSAHALEERPILEVAPTLSELGSGWTTNLVTYLIDPRSHPSEIDYRSDPKTSLLLAYQRDQMQTNNRTGCGMMLYGHGDLVLNSGLFRVYIQRWTTTRALHNAWVGWKMTPYRAVRDHPPVGEDYFWTKDFWRDAWVGQNLVFRRGLFHVVIEAGSQSDVQLMLELANALDAKIRGRPVQSRAGSAR